jgi:hypothetical protein
MPFFSHAQTAKPQSPQTPNELSHRLASTADRNDKYRLVFTTSYSGKLGGYLEKEENERLLARDSMTRSFLESLNEKGKQNYRVVTALPSDLVAVIESDETEYSYRLFSTSSSVHFSNGELVQKLEDISELGFRLIEHSNIYPSCKYFDDENPAFGETCNYIDYSKRLKQPGRLR